MADLKNKVIGGFQVLQEIQAGSGSQGTVYKAICVDAKDGIVPLGKVVALKVMAVQDEGRKQWKKLEKRTADLARMDSQNVVKYYGCFSEAGLFNDIHVVVQEFLQGETLKERLARCPSGLDVDEALIVADAALAGLVHTSRCGIVHRDIKPGNIFLCNDGTVKLIDFEIARQNGGTTTSSAGNIRGSFDYMAPDFTDAEFHGDEQSDVFSMGVVLHEMLTGKTPYQRLEGDDKQANFAFLSRWAHSLTDGSSPIHISSRINRLLAHTEDIMSRSLAPQRENRYSDFATFREGLKAIRFRNLRNGQNVYQMLQFIGKGGFGEVFKARLRQTGQLVAVKHLLKANYAERFYREAKIMKKLHDPCFVQFVDFFMMDAGNSREAFLVMAFLDGMPGSSLRDAIKNAGEKRISRKDLFVAFERYARGLQVMHAEGVFHRDIKPSNLYFPAGRPEAAAIMDLGIARDVNGTATHGQVPGTLDYMPPEVVITDNRGDGGMDIYALGLCFYEALTTKPAFPRLPGGTAAYAEFFERAKSKRKPTFDDLDVQEDRELRDLLTEMTNPELSLRMRDARVLVSRISKLRKNLFPAATDDEPADDAFTSETSEPQVDADTELIAETVAVEGATQGTVATQWGKEKLAALEHERKIVQTRHREMQIRARRLVGRLVVVLIISLSVGVGGSFVWGPVRDYYANARLDEVIGEYQSGNEHEARRKEAAWRAQWDPESFNWLKLDRKTFSVFVGKLDSAKKRIQETKAEGEKALQIARARQSVLERIDGCRLVNGKLDETKFRLLDGWTIPEAVANDEEINRRLMSLGKCVEDAVREKLTVEPPLTRGGRIRRAKEILANSWAVKTLGKGERDRLAKEISEVSTWCVGVVKNNCEADIQLDGRTITVGESSIAVYKDGHSEKGVVSRRGYKSIFLPPGLDSRTYEVNEVDFVAKPIDVRFPRLNKDVKCLFENREIPGGEVVSLLPGNYSCTYLRGDAYEPQSVSFSIRVNVPVVIPEPKDWVYTREFVEKEKARGERERIHREEQMKILRDRIARDCRGLMANEPIDTRQRRLAEALRILTESAAEDRVLSEAEVKQLESEIKLRQQWAVGKVQNQCSKLPITVGGRLVESGKTALLVFEKGLPDDWRCRVSGYETKVLPRNFDGSTITIGDDDLVPEDVQVSLPEMAVGTSCYFKGKRVGKSLSLKPGSYSCVYRKAGYEEQTVQFEVPFGKPFTLPAPAEWKALPVNVSVPELPADVSCLVDGVVVRTSQMLSPGNHVCVFRRIDYKDQKKRFAVVVATPTSLPPVDEWEPSQGLERLDSAEQYAEQKDWSAAEQALADADVKSEANRNRKATLSERVKKQAGLKRKAEQAVEYYDGEFYGDAVRYYYEACKLGYEMTSEDKQRLKHAYEVKRTELKGLIEWTKREIKRGRSVDRSVADLEKEDKSLFEWYNAVK